MEKFPIENILYSFHDSLLEKMDISTLHNYSQMMKRETRPTSLNQIVKVNARRLVHMASTRSESLAQGVTVYVSKQNGIEVLDTKYQVSCPISFFKMFAYQKQEYFCDVILSCLEPSSIDRLLNNVTRPQFSIEKMQIGTTVRKEDEEKVAQLIKTYLPRTLVFSEECSSNIMENTEIISQQIEILGICCHIQLSIANLEKFTGKTLFLSKLVVPATLVPQLLRRNPTREKPLSFICFLMTEAAFEVIRKAYSIAAPHRVSDDFQGSLCDFGDVEANVWCGHVRQFEDGKMMTSWIHEFRLRDAHHF